MYASITYGYFEISFVLNELLKPKEITMSEVKLSRNNVMKYGILTTIIAILPPTSPTTLIGGFSLAGCTGTPTDTSMVRDRLEYYYKI